jgi:dTDP-4-amino-4,6-dideoxygalactose transaminase
MRLTIPPIAEDDLQAVREVLASGHLVQGSYVAALAGCGEVHQLSVCGRRE